MKTNIFKQLVHSNYYKVNYIDIDKIVDKKFVVNLRKKLDMSENVFATAIGVKRKTIIRWEKGTQKIDGCSARLLYLLNNNDNLIKQLYETYYVEKNKK